MKFSTQKKTPLERKRYTVSYANWLDDLETVSTAAYSIDNETDPPLAVDGSFIQPDGLGLSFFVSGGVTDEQYQLHILMTTSNGQIKEDWMTFVVEEP